MKVGLQYVLYRNVNDVVSEKKYNKWENFFSCKGAAFRDCDV